MAFHAAQKTLTGGNDRFTTTHTPVRGVVIFNDSANTGATFLIGDVTLSASIYGYSLAKGTATPMIAGSGPQTFNLDEIYLRGTLNDIARVLYIT